MKIHYKHWTVYTFALLSAIVGMTSTLGIAEQLFGQSPAVALSSNLSTKDNPAVEIQLSNGKLLRLDADGRTLLVVDSLTNETSQTLSLPSERYFASMSLMPKGRVLVWGGVDDNGTVYSDGLWFDPKTNLLASASNIPLSPRAGHSTTVITDGKLLLVGGIRSNHSFAKTSEIWDERTNSVQKLNSVFALARAGHRAVLLPDGSVRLSGGVDQKGKNYSTDSVLNLSKQKNQVVSERWVVPSSIFKVTGSYPKQNALEVEPNSVLALRFSVALEASKITHRSIALVGPGGLTPIDVTPAENGGLLFVVPREALLPESKYTLVASNLVSVNNSALSTASIDFKTAALNSHLGSAKAVKTSLTFAGSKSLDLKAPCDSPSITLKPCNKKSTLRDGMWTPGHDNTLGRWRLYSGKYQIVPNVYLEGFVKATGRTALYGRIAQIDERPVAGVTVNIGTISAKTDKYGEFLMMNLPLGRQEIYVDGSTANRPSVEYGQFVVGVDIQPGKLAQLPYTMYLPRIAARDKVSIRSPLFTDTVLTHPDMPGLEVKIPAGSVIRDRKGKLVTELALVPTPVNRAPFPVAENFPMYFTIEPGGAVVQGLTPEAAKGIQVSYPNYENNSKDVRSSFWIYNPAQGWQVYGKGNISKDLRHFVPELGVALHRMMGGAYTINPNDPPTEPDLPPDGDCCGSAGSGGVANAGDPIDLKTGNFSYSKIDVSISDIAPISLSRSYRQHDTKNRPFGIGTAMNYSYQLYTSLNDNYDTIKLVLPNGTGLTFDRAEPRPQNYSISKWRHESSGTSFKGALLETVNDPADGIGYRLTKRDGSSMFFDSASHSGNGSSRLRFIRNRNGRQIELIYDAGLLVKILSPSGRYIDLFYNPDNRIAAASDHTGRIWYYTYTPQGMLSRVTYPDTTHEDIDYDTVQIATQTPYPILIHRVKSMFNRRGFRELLNEYESANFDAGSPGAYRVIKQTRSDGGVINIDYVHFNGANYGRLVTEPDGSKRRVVFGGVGYYPVSDTLGYGTSKAQTYLFERDPTSGQMSASIDPLNRRTEYVYDANGRIIKVTSMAGTIQARSVEMAYDSLGDLIRIKDPLNRISTFSYIDRCLHQVTNPLNHTTTIICNSDGLPVSITDARGKTTTLLYQNDQLTGVADSLNRATGFAYDSLGRLIVTVDPQGRVQRRQYDSNDRISKVTDPERYISEFAYNANGNLTALLKPHGNGVTYVYDSRDRLLNSTDSLNQTESWTHDFVDRIKTHTDRKGQMTQFDYDILGRPTLTTFQDASSISSTYDAGDRLLSMNDSLSGTQSWNYNDFNQVVTAISPQGTVGYAYDDAGRRRTMTAANQTAVEYQYDDADRLTKILQGSEVVDFSYDVANRLTQMTLPNGIKAGYAYNDVNQVTGIAWLKPNLTVLGDLGYGYDDAGQRVAQTGSFATNTLPAASLNNAFDDNHRQTLFNAQTLTYDANGNLTNDGSRSYYWNARNQLVEIKQSGVTTASFSYDAMGRRYGKTENSQTTTYLYDGVNAVQETRGTTVTPILTGLGVDQRFARTDNAGRTYFLSDALGSTRALTDASGNVTQRYDYTPYGQTTQTTSGFNNPYQYTGRERDESGLYYYRARYYNAAMGRFISEDPVGLAGGLNTYAYVNGDPISLVDPHGLWSLSLSGYYPTPVVIGPGGGVSISGSGFSIDSITFRGGVGIGGGISLSPFGGAPDPTAPCGSNSIGIFADAGIAGGPLGLGLGWNYGGTQSFDANGNPVWQEYGGVGPAFDLNPEWRTGASASVSMGLEITHTFGP